MFIELDPANPTPVDAYGPQQINVSGEWHGATVVFERRLPEHAGDPPGGSWCDLTRPAMPTAQGYSAARMQDVGAVPEFRQPFTDNEARIMWFVQGPHRARVIPAADQPAPVLRLLVEPADPKQLPQPVVPRPAEA